MFHAPTSAKGYLLRGVANVAVGLFAFVAIALTLGGFWSIAGAFLLWMGLRRALVDLRTARRLEPPPGAD